MALYQVVNPATNEVEAEYPTATDAEIQQVLERAAAGYTSWRRTDIEQRSAVLARVAELYAERRDELAAIITREMGKRTKEAKGELSWWPTSTATTPRRARACSPTSR